MQTPSPSDLALHRAEEMSVGVQEIADSALKTALYAVELSRMTANAIEEIDPAEFKARASIDLKDFSTAYRAVAALDLPADLLKAKPATIRRAVALLRIIP